MPDVTVNVSFEERAKDQPPSDQLLTKEELVRLLRVSARTVRKWVHDKTIPYVVLSGRVFFQREEIIKWLEGRPPYKPRDIKRSRKE